LPTRLAFGKPHRLLRLYTVAEPAGLVRDARTPDEFEARASDLADVLDGLTVHKSLLPELLPGQDTIQGSLNQVATVLSGYIAEDKIESANTSIRTLQRIRGVRHAGQH
jgi:hypothetical protein